MGTLAQRAARTGKAHGVVPGFCKRSSLGILSPEFCPPPAPYQVQEAERSPEKESIERPKGFSRFGRFHDPDPLRCYTSTLLLYLKTRWRPRRRPPKTSSKQETHKSSSMESGVVTDPANYDGSKMAKCLMRHFGMLRSQRSSATSISPRAGGWCSNQHSSSSHLTAPISAP